MMKYYTLLVAFKAADKMFTWDWCTHGRLDHSSVTAEEIFMHHTPHSPIKEWTEDLLKDVGTC